MNILIIEDYPTVAQITKNILSTNNFNATVKKSEEISDLDLKTNLYDIIIVDVNLPKGRTIEYLKIVNKCERAPLVMGLSSKATWKEKVEVLNMGADDVIDYPYAIAELLARINSLQRRPKQKENKYLRYRDFNIDTDMKYVTKDNQEVPLRRREYTLLEYLVKNKNRLISRNELLDKVWDYRKMTTSNTVDVHVKRLRDKLADKDAIQTVHGFGYVAKD
ncbi:MAG TPA: response regulator transcription factor [Candidatus Dojkabacteria bacterium]|nr:response regulator transcription factor [Candidatus Dojkabacteria bacterium]